MPYTDKTLECAECGRPFVFSADDQEFFASKGYLEPKRCRSCRANRRTGREGGMPRDDAAPMSRPPRQLYDVICANCGRPTQVPFQPRGSRPVYCRECFQTLGAPAPMDRRF